MGEDNIVVILDRPFKTKLFEHSQYKYLIIRRPVLEDLFDLDFQDPRMQTRNMATLIERLTVLNTSQVRKLNMIDYAKIASKITNCIAGNFN